MVNRGIAPADLTTSVGRFRQNTNDLVYVALDPPVTGFGDYTHNSDDEIESWLAQGGESVYSALGYYFEVLSSQAALISASTKDYDLMLDNTKRASLLATASQRWFDRAAKEDIALGRGDIFEVVGPPLGTRYPSFPEASPYWAQG